MVCNVTFSDVYLVAALHNLDLICGENFCFLRTNRRNQNFDRSFRCLDFEAQILWWLKAACLATPGRLRLNESREWKSQAPTPCPGAGFGWRRKRSLTSNPSSLSHSYFVPQEKGLIRWVPWGWKNLGESIFHCQDGSPWHIVEPPRIEPFSTSCNFDKSIFELWKYILQFRQIDFAIKTITF